jgi:hypothetical protein
MQIQIKCHVYCIMFTDEFLYNKNLHFIYIYIYVISKHTVALKTELSVCEIYICTKETPGP